MGFVRQFFLVEVTTIPHQVLANAEIVGLLADYAVVFQEPTPLPSTRKHDHKIPLKIEAQPVNYRPYKSSFFQKGEIEGMIKNILHNNIIQPSISPFASHVLLMKKKDNTWRFCVDFQELNEVTIKNKFPIPLIDDLLDELQGSSFFSKPDLRLGYHQVRTHERDIEKTSFCTHQGHYEFKVMSFGLMNFPATFQALMNDILKPFLRKFVLVFFDDILIYSSSLKAHISHLKQVLETLKTNQLYAKRSKCTFTEPQVEYLGYIISAEGVATNPKELRGFLGLASYYRKFIRKFGIISKPLTEMLKKNNFLWHEEALEAFCNLKQALCEASILALLDFTK